MNQNPTIPPVPKRPPAKLPNIPPVKEIAGSRSYHVDPYQGINRIHPAEHPKRRPTPSEVDLHVVRHDEQIKGLGKELSGLADRVSDLEDVSKSVDAKLDKICEVQAQEIQNRKISEAVKDDEKVREDQKTKRLQAILIAIPLILSPLLGFGASYLSKPTPDYKTNTVVVAQYNKDSAACLEHSKARAEFEACIREAQLKNTPVFEK